MQSIDCRDNKHGKFPWPNRDATVAAQHTESPVATKVNINDHSKPMTRW